MLAKISNKSVTDIMLPHKDLLVDMIPPKKHCLRHQPANAQIGLMDGNTFCTSLEPRLFTIGIWCIYIYMYNFIRSESKDQCVISVMHLLQT